MVNDASSVSVEGIEIDLFHLASHTTVVGAGVKGDERGALDTILIEIVWVAVGGCNDDNAVVEEGGKETTEDHGIGDVGNLEFIKAKNVSIASEICGNGRNRVVVVRGSRLEAMDARVYIQHEGVEVDAALACDGETVIEEVHNHRLARADVTVDVEGFRDSGGIFGRFRGAAKDFRELKGVPKIVTVPGLPLIHQFPDSPRAPDIVPVVLAQPASDVGHLEPFPPLPMNCILQEALLVPKNEKTPV
ncbi:hypothetical protein BC937DRAFT_89723 [Endogone sp. FLAS-F59071]|nr:hypothetical protein BC937DRAFT_89723 [Endogone sp. FLAS-F59071]|eukprot:RUS23253.1 hypothetical protein BC937DRAFT_89723 [Endogone sp. FLAS-F59071]